MKKILILVSMTILLYSYKTTKVNCDAYANNQTVIK